MKPLPGVADVFRHRRAGVLLHLTSLPGPHGIGDLGLESARFADWCARAGFTLWQMLPVGPVGAGESPYSAASSFAGEPLLVSLERLVEDGLLPRARLRAPRMLGRGFTRHAAARAFKWPRFHEAFERFTARQGLRSRAYLAFEKHSRHWLPGWCRFAASRHDGPLELHAWVQFEFAQQWRRFHEHARGRGVRLVGDLPLFVTLDSADVAEHPELFRLGRAGIPRVVTGVPPDYFSADGQLWGHPHYAWGEHRRQRFRWWVSRVASALERFDAIRLDHFVGLVHAYEIPGGARTARQGRWRPTPGAELLDAIQRRCGRLPLIAEDLGIVTEAVVRLRESFGLPGMRLLQHAFDAPDSASRPEVLPVHCVVYPGTHDNDVSSGWLRGLPREARARFRAAVGADARAPGQALARLAYASRARTAVIPMQDLLGLGSPARMNRPGVALGNWRWRMEPGSTTPGLARRMRRLAGVSGRVTATSRRAYVRAGRADTG